MIYFLIFGNPTASCLIEIMSIRSDPMKRALKAMVAAFVAIALVGVCLVGASPEAKAGLYTLNLLFDDGGTGTGLINIDVYGYTGHNPPSTASTTAGSTLGSATYDANVIAPYYNASANPY